MPDYIAKRDTWISHENRPVKAGEKFTTEFPKGPDGKPMRLSDNIELFKPGKGGNAPADDKPEGGDAPTGDTPLV